MNPENQNQQPDPNAAAPTPPANTFAQQFDPATPAGPQAVASPISQPSAAAPSGGLTSWPGAFGIFKHSKNAVIKNIVPILIFGIVVLLPTVALDAATSGQDAPVQIAAQLLSFIIGAVSTAGLALAYIAGVRDQELNVGDAFKKSVSLILNMIILQILTILAIIVSVLLLIVPFFFVFPRLLLAEYYLVDKNMGPVEALKASWENSKGNVGKVYGIIGVSILMILPIFTIIGIIATIVLLVLYSAAFAVLYQYVLNTKGEAVAASPAAPAAPSAPSAPTAPTA